MRSRELPFWGKVAFIVSIPVVFTIESNRTAFALFAGNIDLLCAILAGVALVALGLAAYSPGNRREPWQVRDRMLRVLAYICLAAGALLGGGLDIYLDGYPPQAGTGTSVLNRLLSILVLVVWAVLGMMVDRWRKRLSAPYQSEGPGQTSK